MRSQPFLLDNTYDEAFNLLRESRDYIKNVLPAVREELDLSTRIKITYHSSRLTSRLLESVSWLMAQKAIHQGELTRKEAMLQGFVISNDSVCGTETEECDSDLPQGLRSLLERSGMLYERLIRLDGMVQTAAEAA